MLRPINALHRSISSPSGSFLSMFRWEDVLCTNYFLKIIYICIRHVHMSLCSWGPFLGSLEIVGGQQPGELQLNFPGAPVLYVWL